tara:strand:- start:2255 stop:3067 length:813 start_codon:yes stop_codon:yes gene_type:complete
VNTNQAICFLFVLLLGVIKVQANNQNLQHKTLVVFSLLEEGEQNNKIKKIHNKLTSFGVDVVNYIDSININVSAETKENLVSYLNERGVKKVLFYSEKKKEISFYSFDYFVKKTPNPITSLKGDSVFLSLKETLVERKEKQTTFLFSPTPEIINKIKIKPFNKILNKPNLTNQKIAITDSLKITTQNLILVEPKEDFRFYYANGINYIIQFFRGKEGFLQKTFNIKELSPTSNKETLLLVLEHTATRNKYFYFKDKTLSETDLLKSFLNE